MTSAPTPIALYRVEIEGKLWNVFTEKDEAEEAVDKLRSNGMYAVLVPKPRTKVADGQSS